MNLFSDASGIVPIRHCPNPPGDDTAQKPWDFLWMVYGAKRPRLHLWGVAERSESFKIMIAGGNHTPAKSCQPEWADLSARRRYASEQPP